LQDTFSIRNLPTQLSHHLQIVLEHHTQTQNFMCANDHAREKKTPHLLHQKLKEFIHTYTRTLRPSPSHRLLNIKYLLQLHHKLPLILRNIIAEELLERIDTLTANRRVQSVFFLEMATVHGLVGAFDFDGDGGLALFADLDLFVVALDGGANCGLVIIRWGKVGRRGAYTRPRLMTSLTPVA
jgi:hypothetical protein